MSKRLALLAALLLAAPPAASGGSGAARLLVSATVVRTVRVSVTEGAARTAALSVRTIGGASWSAGALCPSSGTGAGAAVPAAFGVERYAADPTYLVVTVLADAPLPSAPTRSN
jgi:hypothetical protein